MRVNYDAGDDILHIQLTQEKIVRDVSDDWNINFGYSEKGLSEITILDAKKIGVWPIENLSDLLPIANSIAFTNDAH